MGEDPIIQDTLQDKERMRYIEIPGTRRFSKKTPKNVQAMTKVEVEGLKGKVIFFDLALINYPHRKR